MYCPKCDLEIKGESQKECPICDTLLIENPFADIGQRTAPSDDDDLKLKALIDDIDQKVSESLAETEDSKGAGPAGSEPSENDFRLSPLDDAIAAQMDTTEEQAFMLEPEDDKPLLQDNRLSQNPIESFLKPFEDTDETTPVPEDESIGRHDMLGSAEVPQAPERYQPAEPDFALFDFKSDALVDQPVPPETAELVSHDEQEINTKAILDRALDQLDSVTVAGGPAVAKRKPITATFTMAVLVLMVVIGGGYYLLSINEATLLPQTIPQTSKQEEKVLKQILKKEAEEPVLSANKSEYPHPAERSSAEKNQLPGVEKRAENEAIIMQSGTEQASLAATSAPGGRAQKVGGSEQMNVAEPETVPLKGQKVESPQQAVRQYASTTAEKNVPKPQPATAQKAAERIGSGPYSVHAGSYQNRSIAEAEEQNFKKHGFNAFTEQVDLGSRGTWYRVKIGRFVAREEAKNVEKELRVRIKGVETRVVRNK